MFWHKNGTIFIGNTENNFKFVVKSNDQIEQIFVEVLKMPKQNIWHLHIF